MAAEQSGSLSHSSARLEPVRLRNGILTHVFSPTMTNEVVLAYTFVGFPNVFEDPSEVDRTKVGYTNPTLFGKNVAQIPSFGGSGSAGEAALIFNPGGFEAGGPAAGLYANKYMPSIGDTLTKVWSTHTFKTGFFYEWIRNAQPANNNTNGYMQFVPSQYLHLWQCICRHAGREHVKL